MISSSDSARILLKEGVDTLANAVKVTLGPKGKNAILTSQGQAYLTKDGVSVAKKVYSTNSVSNSAIQIVREAALKTAEEAGDGTTTSTILAQALFTRGLDFLANGGNIIQLRQEFTNLVNMVKLELLSYAKTISYEDIGQLAGIASTSANNDTFIGSLIAEAYSRCGKSGLVTFELSANGLTYIDEIGGTQIQQGLISSEFITDQKKMECSYENPAILLVNNSINSFNDIIGVVRVVAKQNTPLVIIANEFSENTLRGILRNNYQGTTKILPIKLTGFAGGRNDFYLDLRAVTSAAVVSSTRELAIAEPEKYLGRCERVVSNFTSTIFYRENQESILLNKRIEDLEGQKEATKVSNPEAVASIEKRIARLTGKIAVIYVGGKTEVEAKEKYDRVEDAVYATKAALEEGIVEGGGVTFLRIAREIADNNEFSAVLYEPFNQLCINSGIEPSNLYESITKDLGWDFFLNQQVALFKAGIIDPVKVLRVSLENAASIALMLLTTEVVITDE